MKKFIRVLMIVLILLGFAGCSACGKKNKPAIQVDDEGSVVVNPTAAAEAEFLAQTQMAEIEATRQYLLGPIEATAEALQPTKDPLAEATASPMASPAAIYVQPPSGSTTVQLSHPTNCRSGPGTNYSVLYVVPASQQVEVLGRDSSGAYYVVRAPNGEICWLWAHYATVAGNTDALTQLTPPAPPVDASTGNWIEPAAIQVSDEFTWQGHWVVGGIDGGPFTDWFNTVYSEINYVLDYWEADVFQNGNFLDIELTGSLIHDAGLKEMYVYKGTAHVADDQSMAVGKFYSEFITNNQGAQAEFAIDFPILWYQNGNTNQFIGDPGFDQIVPCGARAGYAFPMPSTLP